MSAGSHVVVDGKIPGHDGFENAAKVLAILQRYDTLAVEIRGEVDALIIQLLPYYLKEEDGESSLLSLTPKEQKALDEEGVVLKSLRLRFTGLLADVVECTD